MNFAEMVTNSVLARALALIILALALVGAIVVTAVDYMTGHNPPAEVLNFLFYGVGTSATLVGINFGLILQSMPKPAPAHTAPAPAPATPAPATPAPGGTNA